MMNELKELVERHRAKNRPATMDGVRALEAALGWKLSPEYILFLTTFGVIVFGGIEIYGLGVPDDYYLNVRNSHADLSRDPTYPRNAVPLLDAGDGHYYLYDNLAQTVVMWATPNGGIVQVLKNDLQAFLIGQIFSVQQ
ncbi:SMI1/KNR4 family protein [Janthinobacterium sp. J1-1]|uniref:SMI1/KNR4 family protein n=1 Tax=unclassified Janthinobacterium TaxID=2610881 RepID=UPI0028127FD4|nr:SMI1/KNR4 family protein [Janthinobacterium sp. J1-1]